MEIIIDEQQFIDSHVHLDLAYRNNPGLISWLREVGCLPVSWAFSSKADRVSDLRNYLDDQKKTIQEIRRNGTGCYFLAGVHPRNIPGDLKPEEIRQLLLPSLEDDYCLGIGEIGLENSTDQEKEILLAQLDLADEVAARGKIFGIHTPRENKEYITEQILSLLEPYHAHKKSMVMDHCNVNTIQGVLKSGLWAGITLSPIKTSFQDLEKIINNHPEYLESIMLNTDSGGYFHDDLFRFYHSEQFNRKIRKQLAGISAARFFSSAHLKRDS